MDFQCILKNEWLPRVTEMRGLQLLAVYSDTDDVGHYDLDVVRRCYTKVLPISCQTLTASQMSVLY